MERTVSENSSNGSQSNEEALTVEIPKNLDPRNGVKLKIQNQDELIIEIPPPTKDSAVMEIPPNLVKDWLDPAFWPQLCIYQTPKRLRRVNPKAYTPQSISIGPFHYKDELLHPMNKQKLIYLAAFCARVGKNWTDLSAEIEKSLRDIRRCYEEKFNLDDETFVRMVLLDSVFIIEFFLRRRENLLLSQHGMSEEYKNDYILGKPTRENSLLEDLILLENQLPYFALEDLYHSATRESDFLELVQTNLARYLAKPQHEVQKPSCDCFSFFYCFWVSNCFSAKTSSKKEILRTKEDTKPLHFTDLVRTSRAYPNPAPSKSKITKHFVKRLYNASRLKEAGVNFKVEEEAWPLSIKFDNGVLTMPIFRVESNTERVIRNLMAFEQCHHPNDPYLCDYMWILEFLITNENDVDVLVQNGVIVNLLGSNEAVAEMVNKLFWEISATGSTFYPVSMQLNEHCDNRWRQAVAIMRKVYFGNIWLGTGTIFAVLLLFLTLVQSIYAIRSMF